jgi:predicted ferric reductase
MKLLFRGIFWAGLYVFLVTVPLVVAALSVPRSGSPSLLVDLADGLGYVALAMMALELALVSRMDEAAGAFGLDALLQFHREVGIGALLLVVAHGVLLLSAGGYPLAVLGLGPSVPLPVRLGTLSAAATLVLVVLAVTRRRLGTRYETWQLLHGLLAVTVVGLAAAHVATLGRFAASTPMRVLGALYLALFVGILLRYRLLRPLALLRKPWEVAANLVELGASRTLVLRPVGHPGFSFQPGQFAWLNVGRTPFHLEQHPISMSSGGDVAPGGEVSFTIRDLGDWSGRVVPALRPGARVWVDGPYGVFSPDREEGPGYVLIGGGIGVAPLVSMLETLAGREDRRPMVLLYGTHREEDLTLRDRIESLRTRIDLHVAYVLENPPPGWTGEAGYVDEAMLRRHLPRHHDRLQYFVCGPPPLMDAMERILPGLGIAAERIHAERFDMV